MQSDLVDTFLDLIETRSFHRTAERLGLTQSTVSARVQALEGELGARLFTRSRAGTDLTPEGRRFEPHARSLRHAWGEARRSVSPPAQAWRLGIQHDLAARHLGAWVADFRRALPAAAFYIEADYSAQMCADLATGGLDLAVLFTPKPHPDLHFTELGEVPYHLVASDTDQRAGIDPATYVLAQFSPAFRAMHDSLLPELAKAPVSVGQSAAVEALLTGMGGAGYVLDRTAARLVQDAGFHAVTDAPVLRQPVFAATHLKHRIAPVHRRLVRIVQRNLAGR